MQNTQGVGAYRSSDACARCGRGIDVTKAAYADDGMICTTCEASDSVRAADAAARSSTSGLGPFGWGLLSLVCNPFFVPSFLAIAGGIRDLASLRLLRREDTADYGSIQAKAIAGIVLGSFVPLIVVGVVGLVVATAAVAACTASYDQAIFRDRDRANEYEYEYDDDDPYDPGSYDAIHDPGVPLGLDGQGMGTSGDDLAH